MGFTETLALCSTQIRLRSSETDPRAVVQMICTAAVFGTRPGVWGRWCLGSAPSFTVQVHDEKVKWPVSTSDFYSFSQARMHIKTTLGSLEKTCPGLSPIGSNSVSGVRPELLCVFFFSFPDSSNLHPGLRTAGSSREDHSWLPHAVTCTSHSVLQDKCMGQ